MSETKFRNLEELKNLLPTGEDIKITPNETISMFRELSWDRRFKEIYGVRGHYSRYAPGEYGRNELVFSVHYGDADAGKWSLIADYSPARLRFCNSPGDITVTVKHLSHVVISLSGCSWFDVILHFNREETEFAVLCFDPSNSEVCRDFWKVEE